MGRLDDIVARNKHPGKHAKNRFPLGIGVAVFVFIIIVLMVFTDLDESPQTTPSEPATAEPTDKRVRGIGLYKERPRAARDAGPSD